MKGYVSKEVVCPFYHYEQSNGIVCEGFAADTTIKTIFADEKARKIFRARHCKGDYKQCPIAIADFKKYD